MVPGQGSHGPDGLVPRIGSSADQLRTHVGRGWRPLPGALGQRPRPGNPTHLARSSPPVRREGTGRLQAGWRTRPHPSRGVGQRSGTAPGTAPAAEYLGSRAPWGRLTAANRATPPSPGWCRAPVAPVAPGGQGLNPGPFLCLHRDRSIPLLTPMWRTARKE